MDDSVKSQQLLISYAMKKGGWKNMPLPSDWIQISVGNAILYINCLGYTILDVHPFKYLALGNDKEKKWVKTHISQQYDAKKKKANYISCWATCPFPEKGWMILYHVTKNQILYYHKSSNTLTAKHPCRILTALPHQSHNTRRTKSSMQMQYNKKNSKKKKVTPRRKLKKSHTKSKSMKMLIKDNKAKNKHRICEAKQPPKANNNTAKTVRQKAREIERQIAMNSRSNSLRKPKMRRKNKRRSKTPKMKPKSKSKTKAKALSERLGKPHPQEPNAKPNRYNWNQLQQSSSYATPRSLSKSMYRMYAAASRNKNVLFPIQNKATINKTPPLQPQPHPLPRTRQSRTRTRINRSKSNPDRDPKAVPKLFKVASPNKRRRNAVGMSSQLALQSQLLALTDHSFAALDIDEDTPDHAMLHHKPEISISLSSLSVQPAKHATRPTTPTLLTQSKSSEDNPVGEATAKEETCATIHEEIDTKVDQNAATAKTLPTATALVVREKKRSATCIDILNVESIGIKPRSRSHSRRKIRSRHSRASSMSSTSSRGSISEDRTRHGRRASSSSTDSSDESSISSVSNSYSTDSDSDSTMSSDSSRSSRSSRHSRSSSIHSRSSRSSTPISNNKHTKNASDKLVNAQSSLLGNMTNMMRLMSQQQQQQQQLQLQQQQEQAARNMNSDGSSVFHNKSMSLSFVNINDDATTTQFDQFMTNFMTNFDSNGVNNSNMRPMFNMSNITTADNGITNRTNVFDKYRRNMNTIPQGLKGTIMSPIMLQNSLVDDTSASCSASDNDMDTPTPV
eukprot:269865_1